MIYTKLNAGCGYQLITEDGWLNVDTEYRGAGNEQFRFWDITEAPNTLEHDLTERFDFILLNHVLMSLNEYNVHKALINLHRALKPGGTLQVIDMDILKVFAAYEENRLFDIPIETGDFDDRLCFAISGYGTRKSVFTTGRMFNALHDAGFRVVVELDESEHNTRPKESLIVEATK